MKKRKGKILLFLITILVLLCVNHTDSFAAHTNHSYTVKGKTVSPTCSSQGYTIYKCSGCSATTKKNYVPATNSHNYTVYQRTVQSTCTSKGYDVYKCSSCTKTTNKNFKDYKSHSYTVALEVIKYPTCTEYGTQKYRCSGCSAQTSKSLSPYGHLYNGSMTKTKQETCTTDGEMALYCTRSGCGALLKTQSVPKLGHNHTIKVSEKSATCVDNGYIGYKCSRCSDVYTQTINAYGHTSFTKWEIQKDATCTSNGTKIWRCGNCGVPMGSESIAAKGHLDTGSLITSKSPTCTENGSASRYCQRSGCGVAIATIELPKLDHDFSIVKNQKDATCSDAGFVNKKCSRCDETQSTTIEKKQHINNSKWEVAEISTCAKEGTKVQNCTECGIVLASLPIAKKEHQFNGQFQIVKEATCTEEGVKEARCSVCSELIESIAIPMTEHIYKKTVKEKDPTCTEGGFKQIQCLNCDSTISKSYDKLEHNYNGQYTTVKKADCQNTGMEAMFCTRNCGHYEYEREIPIQEHIFSVLVSAEEPDCYQGGYHLYRCAYENCKETKCETYDKKEHNYVKEVIPGTDMYYFKCTECGSIRTKEPEVDDIDFDWNLGKNEVLKFSADGNYVFADGYAYENNEFYYREIYYSCNESVFLKSDCTDVVIITDKVPEGANSVFLQKGSEKKILIAMKENKNVTKEYCRFTTIRVESKSGELITSCNVEQSNYHITSVEPSVAESLAKKYSNGSSVTQNEIKRILNGETCLEYIGQVKKYHLKNSGQYLYVEVVKNENDINVCYAEFSVGVSSNEMEHVVKVKLCNTNGMVINANSKDFISANTLIKSTGYQMTRTQDANSIHFMTKAYSKVADCAIDCIFIEKKGIVKFAKNKLKSKVYDLLDALGVDSTIIQMAMDKELSYDKLLAKINEDPSIAQLTQSELLLLTAWYTGCELDISVEGVVDVLYNIYEGSELKVKLFSVKANDKFQLSVPGDFIEVKYFPWADLECAINFDVSASDYERTSSFSQTVYSSAQVNVDELLDSYASDSSSTESEKIEESSAEENGSREESSTSQSGGSGDLSNVGTGKLEELRPITPEPEETEPNEKTEIGSAVSAFKTEMKYDVVNDWGSGFLASIEIVNTTTEPMKNWSVSFEYDEEISSSWGAELKVAQNGYYEVKNYSYTPVLNPGESVKLQFIVNNKKGSNPPTNFILMIENSK